MQVISKQIEVNKTLNSDEIEKELSEHGEFLRWAIVLVNDNKFLIDAVFIKN